MINSDLFDATFTTISKISSKLRMRTGLNNLRYGQSYTTLTPPTSVYREFPKTVYF